MLRSGVVRGPVCCRTVGQSFRFLSVTSNVNQQIEDSVKTKKKPLSRLPIGGSEQSSSQRVASDSIEFTTWKAAALFVVVGGTLYYFFSKEKKGWKQRKKQRLIEGMVAPLLVVHSI